MGQLKGNDLTEWIKALEPIDALDFQIMEIGTKIIKLDSQTIEPVTFVGIEHDEDNVWIYVQEIPTLFSGNNWYYYPTLPPDEPIKTKTIGKVKELGDGKWR